MREHDLQPSGVDLGPALQSGLAAVEPAAGDTRNTTTAVTNPVSAALGFLYEKVLRILSNSLPLCGTTTLYRSARAQD